MVSLFLPYMVRYTRLFNLTLYYCLEAMGWEFGDFEKDFSWDLTLGWASPAWGYGMHRAFVGSNSKYSQHSKNCVSLLILKNQSQEVNKRFVPEQRRVVSVSYFPASVYFTWLSCNTTIHMLNCNMHVIIICICCLCRINVILHIRYCNLWWYDI